MKWPEIEFLMQSVLDQMPKDNIGSTSPFFSHVYDIFMCLPRLYTTLTVVANEPFLMINIARKMEK